MSENLTNLIEIKNKLLEKQLLSGKYISELQKGNLDEIERKNIRKIVKGLFAEIKNLQNEFVAEQYKTTLEIEYKLRKVRQNILSFVIQDPEKSAETEEIKGLETNLKEIGNQIITNFRN